MAVSPRIHCAFWVALATLGLATELRGQTWDGGGADNNWSTANNWNPNGAPANDGSADIVFTGSPRPTSNINVPWSIKSFTVNGSTTFNNVNNPVTVTGNQLTIGAGGASVGTAQLGELDLNAPLLLSADQIWQISQSGRLNIGTAGGTIDTNGFTLTTRYSVDAVEQITVNGDVVGSGGITVESGNLNMKGTGNSFTGPVNLNGGGITPFNNTSLGSSNGQLNFDGGGFFLSQNGLSFARSGTIGAGGAKFTAFTSNRNVTLTGDFSGPGAVTVSELGTTLILGGTNTYAGGTFLNFGAGVQGTTFSLQGTITGDNSGNTNRVVFSQNFDGTSNSKLNNVFVYKIGTGVTTLAGSDSSILGFSVQAGTIRLGNSQASYQQGLIEVYSGAVFDLNGFDITTKQLYSVGSGASVLLGAATLTVGEDDAGPSGPIYQGAISGSGAVTKIGTGIQTLSGINTFSGPTNVNGGTLKLGGGQAIADTSAVVLANVAGTTLDLNGSNETIGSLAGGGLTGGNVTLGNRTLSVGGNNSNTSFGGILSGTGRLTKVGAGILTLTGANTYSGGTNLNQGELEVAANGNLGNVSGALNFNGGTLRVTGTVFSNTARTITWGANGGGFDVVSAANIFTLNQSLSGNGGLTKSGLGTLVLSGNQTYSGPTTINGGTLKSQGTLNSSGGTVTVNSAGTLAISGILPRRITGDGTINAIGPLSAGDLLSADGFDFDGAVSMGANSVILRSQSTVRLGGATALAGGTFSTINGLEQEGTFTGFGRVNSNITNSGTINGTNPDEPMDLNGFVNGTGALLGNIKFSGTYSPGLSPAQVMLGSPVFANALLMELAGTNPGTGYDQLLISGNAFLDGTLTVNLLDDFSPSPGESFFLIVGGVLSGAFDAVTLPPLADPNWSWRIDSSTSNFSITVIPEPGTGILFACGVLVLLAAGFVFRHT